MKIPKKSLIYIIPVIIIMAAVIVIIFINKPTSYEDKIYTAVGSEIIIERDKNGIPFIKAATINDAYFAVGFLHGQDRLPLLEYFRAIASGKLSELIGDRGTFLDKLSLTVGFARQAENITAKLKSPYAEYFNSYVTGINKAKDEYRTDIPLRGIAATEWTLKDAVSILLLFDWSDAYLNNKKLMFPVPGKLNPKMLKEIIPADLLYQYSDDERNIVNLLLEIKKTVGRRIGRFQEGFAFYVSAENMTDGKSVSGFTLDGPMSVYPKWYPVSISLGTGDSGINKIEGVTASGLPFIFFGRNRDISFYGFNLNVETQEFYVERTRVQNRVQQYYRNGAWNNFTVLNDNFLTGVRGEDNKESLFKPRATDIGPVISDLSGKDDDYYCLVINSLTPDETYIKSLFDLPLADSIAKAKITVRNINSLPRLYLFTSSDDADCAYSGKTSATYFRKLFLDSSVYSGAAADLSFYNIKLKASINVIGDKIFENAPRIIQDRLVYGEADRNSRIKSLLEREAYLSPKDIAASLNDASSPVAERFIAIFNPILSQVPVPSAKLSRIYFSNWNYSLDTESVAATIFNTMLINMLEETIRDEMGNSTGLLMENYNYLLDNFYVLLSSGNSTLFDDITTKDSIEDRDDIFNRAFLKTLRYLNKQCGPEMEQWKWGNVHKGHFRMPLRRQSFFEKQSDRFEDVGMPGGASTVKKGDIGTKDLLAPGNISVISGIFYQDLQLSFFSLPVSQTLDPNSEYFRNYSNSGEFVSFDSNEVLHRLVLAPAEK